MNLEALLYNAVLAIFKSLDSLLDRNTPQLHRMHSKISELTRDLFKYILNDEILPRLSFFKLKK